MSEFQMDAILTRIKSLARDMFYVDGELEMSSVVFGLTAIAFLILAIRSFLSAGTFDPIAYGFGLAVIFVAGGHSIGSGRRLQSEIKKIRQRLDTLEQSVQQSVQQ